MEKVQPTQNKGGTWVPFGDKEYLVPPLSLRQVRLARDKIATMRSINGLPTDEQMDSIVDIVHGALQRNYTDIKRDDVEDMVDLGNFLPVMTAVISIAGFKPQEAGAPGEAPASTGTTSTSP